MGESDNLQSDASPILHHLAYSKSRRGSKHGEIIFVTILAGLTSLSAAPLFLFFFLYNKPSFNILSNQDFSSSVDGNPTSPGHLLLVSHFPPAENVTLRLLKDITERGEGSEEKPKRWPVVSERRDRPGSERHPPGPKCCAGPPCVVVVVAAAS